MTLGEKLMICRVIAFNRELDAIQEALNKVPLMQFKDKSAMSDYVKSQQLAIKELNHRYANLLD